MSCLFFCINALFAQSTGALYHKKFNYNNIQIKISEYESVISKSSSITEKHYLLEINKNNTLIKKDVVFSVSGIPTISSSGIRDLDNDGNIEIFIIITPEGSGAYSNFVYYELTGYELISYKLPKLNSRINKFYRGHDIVKVTKNCIIQKFPAYNKNDANCCPTAGEINVKFNFTNSGIIETGYSFNTNNSLNNNREKIISFKIVKAENLPNMDVMSSSDCWLKILQNKNIIGKTEVKKNNNSPIFNVVYSLNKNSKGPILVEVYDRDMTKDELIGVVTLRKYISGTYPILRELSNGNIKEFGKLYVEFK